MYLIRFALKNPYAVLAVTAGLCLLGAAVIPLFPVDILPDFKRRW
jgi:hydrophobic/amphiphilic exporter-1 (mainly G- bacteria), HAE1 family